MRLPESGMIVPGMGRSAKTTSLADALLKPVQQRVLALLFGQPERRFQSAELIRLARSGTGAVHRQLERLAAAGLLSVTRSGNQKHYQANRESPIFAELQSLVVKTVGLAQPLRSALEGKAKDIRAAFVYGSVAKGRDRAGSDIDLLVISDKLRYPDLFQMLQQAETVLARPINPTVLTPAEWRARRARKDSFAHRIAAQPKVFVIGSDDDLV